jgi:hypothetical protein
MKYLLRFVVLGFMFAPSSAWAAACSGTAYAHTAGNFSNTTAVWCNGSVGSCTGGNAFCTLTAGNAVVFDSNSGAGTYTVDEAISIATLATSGATAGITIAHTAGNTLTVSGASFDLSGVTYTPSTALANITFGDTTNVTITTGAGSSNTAQQLGTIVFNGASGVFTFADNLNTKPTSTVTLTNGEWDLGTNNVNANIGQFSSSNGNTRSINGGTGTITILGVGAITNVWDLTTSTNFSFSGAAVNITFAPAGAMSGQLAFITAAKTYGAIIVTFPSTTSSSASANSLQVETVGPTFASLTVSGAGWIAYTPSATAYTITGAFTCTGTLTYPLGNISATPGVNTYVNLAIGGASTANYCTFIDTKITGAGALTTTNSFDLGGNTGFTINPPTGSKPCGGGTANGVPTGSNSC